MGLESILRPLICWKLTGKPGPDVQSKSGPVGGGHRHAPGQTVLVPVMLAAATIMDSKANVKAGHRIRHEDFSSGPTRVLIQDPCLVLALLKY